jgi:hypothetical protein
MRSDDHGLVKTTYAIVLAAGVAACSDKKPEAAPPPKAPAPSIDAAPPAPDAARGRWGATSELLPAAGTKMKSAVVAFSQWEGDRTTMSTSAPLAGLAPGKYHLVIHEGRDCGANGSEAGAAWPASFDLEVVKGVPAQISTAISDLMLDGDHSIVGHTLVLHADAKGKLGKVIACGAIFARSISSAP